VEQAEALLHAIDLINARSQLYGRQEHLTIGYGIMDTCGNAEASECFKEQIQEYRNTVINYKALATIVGPYYDENIDIGDRSMTKKEFAALSTQLTDVYSGGMLSLLDLPFWYSEELQDLDNVGKTSQMIMLQQTCQLQAWAAVDFLAQQGWANVSIVASRDSCGKESLSEIHNHIQRKKLGCHFNNSVRAVTN
jgi:hypothetical protein